MSRFRTQAARSIDPAFEERVRRQMTRVADSQQAATGRSLPTQNSTVHAKVVRKRLTVGLSFASLIAVGVFTIASYERHATTRIDSAGVPAGTTPRLSTSLEETIVQTTTSESTKTTRPDPSEESTSTGPTTTSDSIEYVVKDGDTLYSIAQRHGTTSEAIAEVNAWPDGTKHILLSGMTILLPGS